MYKRSIIKKASELKENDPICWKTYDGKYLGRFKHSSREKEFNYQYRQYLNSYIDMYSFEKEQIFNQSVASTECEGQNQNQNQDPAPVSERRKSRRSKGRKMRRTRKSRRCAFA
jgi:hypothetical protein